MYRWSTDNVVLSSPRRLQKRLLPIFKNTKKNEKNTTQKYKIRTAGFGKYKWLVLIFFNNLYPDFHSEHGVGSLAYFWICLFFVFCIFEILGSYFFCILYFWNCWFVFFCILYFWAYAFVFFWGNFYKKYAKHRNKIQKVHFDVQKCNLYFCIFFWYFPTLHRLHFVLLYFFSFFRHAVKEQNRESINVCCIFLLLIILPCSVCVLFFKFVFTFFWYYFWIFEDSVADPGLLKRSVT